ncbi:MAG: tetratricopeptide repeat protein [Candidatus Hodarchaeota archaeon]
MPKLKELKHAEELKNAGKFEEVLQIVSKLEKEEGLSKEDLLSLHILQSSSLLALGKLKDSQNLAERVLEQSKKLKSYDKSIDALNLIAWVYWRLGKLEEALDKISEAEEIIRVQFSEPITEIQKKHASLFLIKGGIFFARGNLEAIKKCLEEGLELAKLTNDKKLIMQFTLNTGTYYGIKGNIDLAIKYHSQALAVAKEINDKQNIIIALNNLGWVFRMQGKLDKAYENINESYVLCKEINSPKIHIILDSLFHVALDKGDLKLAQKYLDQMNELKDQEEYEIIELDFLINKALLLKANPRASNLSKAQKILRKAVEEEVVLYEAHIDALLNLCDLLLIDLRNTKDLEILKEMQPYFSRLLDIAEKNNSYPLIAEMKLLQARLALLTFNIKNARKLLSEAQHIAEKYGLNRLSMKISSEHDELLKQMDLWEKLKISDSPIGERLKLTQIENEMKRMIQKRTVDVPKLTEEEPLLLLVMSEGGVPAFSHTFSKDWDFSDDLLSGFLTSFDSISKEVFSEGLDRAKFGHHTIIINPIENFLVCYLFKGQSYFAKQKLGYFTGHMERNSSISQIFNKFLQSFHTIQLKENPILRELIMESFLTTDQWLLKE